MLDVGFEEQQEENDKDLDGNLPSTSSSKRKSPHMYTTEEDIIILKEVLVEKPFAKIAAKEWKSIHEKSKINVKNGAALKKRYEIMMEHFQQNNTASLRGYDVFFDISFFKLIILYFL